MSNQGELLMFEGEQRICSMLQGEHYLQIIASFGETSKWDFHLHFYSFEGEYSRYARERVPPMAVILLSHLLESPNSHHGSKFGLDKLTCDGYGSHTIVSFI